MSWRNVHWLRARCPNQSWIHWDGTRWVDHPAFGKHFDAKLEAEDSLKTAVAALKDRVDLVEVADSEVQVKR